MPHYRNGREAREGDTAIATSYNNRIVAGVIHSINPDSTSCNAQLSRPVPGGFANDCVSLAQCVHVEDAFSAFKAKEESDDNIRKQQAAADAGSSAAVNADAAAPAAAEAPVATA